MVLGITILSNGKGHFGPTYRNDQTGQRGPPSKVVPNIPVGPNRNGPFYMISNRNFRNFGLNGKRPIFVAEGRLRGYASESRIERLTERGEYYKKETKNNIFLLHWLYVF